MRQVDKEPPLSFVEIAGDVNIEGRLLSRTESTWYLFDQTGELVAVPNAKVDTARISPEH
jgi:hypothetical protein